MKSICFIEELQTAVVELRKTETRRLTNPQPDDYLNNSRGDFILPDGSRADLLSRHHLIRPRYKVGEIIYIKEPYVDDIDPDRIFYKYAPADIQILQELGYGDFLNKPGFWRNKQSMPARLARYFLRITARHGERLQDITEDAAKREGVRLHQDISDAYAHYSPHLHFTEEQIKNKVPCCQTARASFQTLMEMFEGPRIWEKNPFVWVYEFEFITELTTVERRFYNLTNNEWKQK